ncbi:MAG: ribbon-helix-helix domain-containing protein [Proteobacteria bacterium]|nr:ribbon-helix-helix domain-containing protein [Pseudomonadota bacterium]
MAAVNVKQVIAYLTPKQHEALKKLTARTRVPMAAYFREAIDDLLAKHKAKS